MTFKKMEKLKTHEQNYNPVNLTTECSLEQFGS